MSKDVYVPYNARTDAIRVSGIVSESVVDGPGIRLSVFAQGCSHQCLGCHNPETHSYDGGHLVSINDIIDSVRANSMLDGISLSGGEPFDQASAMTKIADGVRFVAQETGRKLDIWCWTGYTAEVLCRKAEYERSDWKRLLNAIDVLIDGPFVRECATMQCPWRGSSNQRIFSSFDIKTIFKKLSCEHLKEFNTLKTLKLQKQLLPAY